MKLYTETGAPINFETPAPSGDDLQELAEVVAENRATYFRLQRESAEARRMAWNFLRTGQPFALAG